MTGLVQGVLYRDFTQKQAWLFSISGYSKNLPDGTVEVVAEGKEDRLKKFIETLKIGPSAAKVKEVTVEWGAATGEFPGFTIE